MEFVVPLKNLVVGIADQFEVIINKSLVQRKNDGLIVNRFVHFIKNVVKAFGLLLGGAENIVAVTCISIIVQIFKAGWGLVLNRMMSLRLRSVTVSPVFWWLSGVETPISKHK